MGESRTTTLSAFERPWAYVALTKPDVTFLVAMTTVAGFYLGSRGPLDWALMLHTLGGTLLVAAGTAALNQYVEREMDSVMRRTAARPLPSGTLQPREVLIFGVASILLGIADGEFVLDADGAANCSESNSKEAVNQPGSRSPSQ